MPGESPFDPIPLLGVGFNPINDQPDSVPVNFTALVGVLKESPNSPQIELAEHCTFTHTYTGLYDTCVAHILMPGSYVEDEDDNVFRVQSCNVSHTKGNRGTMVLRVEWMSGPTLVPPPDEFSVDAIEFNPAVEKNPIFVVSELDDDSGDDVLTLEDVVRARAAAQAPQIGARTENANNPYGGSGSVAEALFNKLVSLYRQGVDTYYLAGFRITWSRYYFINLPLDRGGYTQQPAGASGNDIIPTMFVRDADGNLTIPGEIEDSFDYLRLADKRDFVRTWTKVTRTWIGGPDGHWDNWIYKDVATPSPVDQSVANWATDPGDY